MRSVVVIFLLMVSSFANAQVASFFTVSDSSGCEPLVVTFFNQSTGSGNLTYNWNFGNGQTSALRDPWPINYLTDGNYTVTLVVSNGSETDQYSMNIQVFNKPDPHFSFTGTSSGCLPIVLSFSDQSVQGSAPLDHWYWEFGDGGSSTLQDPVYSYNIPGTWNVMLQVTDTNGCNASVIVSPVAHVSPVPVIHVSANPSHACLAPTTVQFTNTTSGMSPLSYDWDFGDGGISSLENPSHTYNQIGVYNVSVTVTDPNGCVRDTVFPGMVNLTQVNASFIVSTGNDTICPGQWVTFINTSGNPSSLWTFFPGATSMLTNPYMMYPFPGTYTVSLISAPNTICADTTVQNITVQDFQTSIIVDPPSKYSCEVPYEFFFNYSGPDANQYNWTLEDPAIMGGFSYSNASSTDHTYTMESPYNYNVTLVSVSKYGCVDTAYIEVYIDPIISIPVADTAGGCVPHEVNFSDLSYSHEPIVSWYWEFGDGNVSTQQNPVHTYDTVGIFSVSLTVVNDSGCTDTKSIYVTAGYHHFVNFKICHFQSPDDTCRFCPMDSIQFDNLTTDTAGNYIDSPGYLYPLYSGQPNWIWFFGNDAFEPYHPIPDYFAATDTGWQYNLFLICDYLGCVDSVILDYSLIPDSVRLYVNGPLFQNFTQEMLCDDTYSRTFNATLFDWDYCNWDFGDSTFLFNSTDTSVYHTYPDTGYYFVTCTAYNDSTGCDFFRNMTVYITDVKALIDPVFGDTICRDSTILLSADSCDFNTWHQWTVNNITVSSTPSEGYFEYTPPPFTQTGDYPVTLIIHDIYNCYDTSTVNIHVTKPAPSFIADPSTGCAPVNVHFTSTSLSDVGVQSVTWNFGDGSNPGSGSDVYHQYSNSGNYNIIMVVVDSAGCISTQQFPQGISTGTAIANFTSNDTRCCLGDTLFLNNLSTGSQLANIWDLGDGTFSYVQNPFVVYAQPGIYDVSLIISDNLGCYDTLEINDFFEVQYVNAHFDISNSDTNCYPFRPILANTSPVEFFPQCEWDFGDGFTSFSYNPSHTYTQPGNFWLTLTVSTAEGCIASDSVFIHVGGPFAEISKSDSLICAGDEVQFNLIDTLNLYSVNWNFGDGGGSSSFTTSHTYTYVPQGNDFLVSLIYCSEPSCCIPASQDTISVYEVIAGFDIIDPVSMLSDTAICPPSEILFTNTSTGATIWEWNFGNGQPPYSGFSPQPVLYQNPGTDEIIVTVSQVIFNDIGCTDTISHEIVVYGTPPMSVCTDTIICLGNTTVISAQGGTSIQWHSDDNLTDTLSYVLSVQPDSTSLYIATITDTIGCKNSDSVWVFVQQVPELYHSNDTSIVIGEIINLYANSDQANTTIIWSPSEWISCTGCENPFSQPMESISYNIVLQDSLGCFTVYATVNIEVIEEYTLDMPVVFTPNGDGTNDVVYVKGWGIKQLLEFSVYNRWGERIYYSDDLSDGWDGTFNGIQQNIDTYTYYVKVLTYAEKTLDKKGNITLIR